MGYLIIFGIAILILLVIWAWINVKLLRKPEENRIVKNQPAARAANSELHTESFPTKSQAESVHSVPANVPADSFADANPPILNDVPTTEASEEETPPWFGRQARVEVVHGEVMAEDPQKGGIFHRPQHPFQLNEVRVPDFAHEAWQQCFYRLTEEAKVVGWIAFQGETVGACDREYDNSFLDTLRKYQRTVAKVQKEVGLSQVAETSIVGEEGKVWFVTVVDNEWIALFMDKSASTEGILEDVLPKLRAAEA